MDSSISIWDDPQLHNIDESIVEERVEIIDNVVCTIWAQGFRVHFHLHFLHTWWMDQATTNKPKIVHNELELRNNNSNKYKYKSPEENPDFCLQH